MSTLAHRQPHWFYDRIGTPYDLPESIGVVWRNLFPDRDSHVFLEPCPFHHDIAPDIAPVLCVGFVGDIMSMCGYTVEWDAGIPAFFAGCDALVGNFEATIAARNSRVMQERHDPSIIPAMGALFEPSRFYLSVANNHAGDFDALSFRRSCAMLCDAGFHVFGQRERPFVDIGSHLRVSAGSMWTNMPCGRIADLNDITAHIARERFNLLFPHWGYEMESNPRASIVALGDELLEHAGAVIGHHSHVPQSIALRRIAGRTKILAPSLGDLCSRERFSCYYYGAILKITIGQQPDGNWTVGTLDWRYVTMTPSRKSVRVTTSVSIPYQPAIL